MATHPPIYGAGLGLRRSLIGSLAEQTRPPVNFLEIAPENWIGLGGRDGHLFRAITEHYPVVLHGLSLSLGGPGKLDEDFTHRIKQFMDEHNITLYSEHLSYCSDEGHLYDLMPIPFTEEAVHYVAGRIRQVQDILEQRIAIENISYYAAPGQEMTEQDFVTAVITEANCGLLLDVNNAYVNGHNHGYDPLDFIRAMPRERIDYLHVAGHYCEGDELIIDTHGAPVVDPVWHLLERTYDYFGALPTLLERDFNIPSLDVLLDEIAQIVSLQQHQEQQHSVSYA